jgi:3-deoxy-D-manno-octulosonate 8-phosphate phosphatase (KDO 8-P phosphatase)
MNLLIADAENRAKKIKLILFDVDGVLTDGTLWFFPAPQAGPRATDA